MLATLICALGFIAPVVNVTPPSFNKAKEPQIAIDSGHVYITYGMGDTLYLSRSDDDGASYGEPVKIGEPGKLSLGMRRGPRICVRGNVVTVTATYGAQGRGRDGDLTAFRSADGGKTWSQPVKVNDVSGSAREGLHGMAVADDGTLACTWLDLREGGTRLYLATSADGGSSWSENRLVYASPDGSICECCHPSLVFDRSGVLHVMFRNSLSGARDMYATQSLDKGMTFAEAVKLGTGTWSLNACPMDGGTVAASAKGEVTAIWRKEGSVFASGLSQGEKELGAGRQPWMAYRGAETVFVWLTGKAIRAKLGDSEISTIAAEGDDPVVASDGKITIASWSHDGIQSMTL